MTFGPPQNRSRRFHSFIAGMSSSAGMSSATILSRVPMNSLNNSTFASLNCASTECLCSMNLTQIAPGGNERARNQRGEHALVEA